MSINVKTITIGSHLLVNGVQARLTKIDEFQADELPKETILRFKAVVDGDIHYCGGFASSDFIEPIPITPELLKEIGFEYKDKGCWSHWWKGNFHLTRRGESPYWDYYGDIYIQYLHELENLYYVIYETELIRE